MPHWAVIPGLIATLMAGPAGRSLYLLVRAALGHGGFLLAQA